MVVFVFWGCGDSTSDPGGDAQSDSAEDTKNSSGDGQSDGGTDTQDTTSGGDGGTGKAGEESLIAAIATATAMARRRYHA